MGKYYLKVPKRHRALVTRMGARFDGAMGRYYVPDDIDQTKFDRWKYADKQPTAPTQRAMHNQLIEVTPSMGPPFVDPAPAGEYVWLEVPYVEKDLAKHEGARWDPWSRKWFVQESHPKWRELRARWPN